ncbi:MAG: OmpA family protein [Prevotella sp.]|nr:OmpA family protein [Prevotella sp.]
MKKLLTIIAVAMFAFSTANAQECKGKLKSWSYIEAQGGLQFTSTDAPIDKLLTPTVGLSFGHYFFPSVGLRLHANAWQAKSGFDQLDQYYKWKYVTTDADLLVNLTNLFSKSPKHALNVILVGGFGLNYAWDNDELKAITAQHQDLNTYLAWDDNRMSHNIRAGLRLETDVTKPIGFSLEVDANSLSDRFNSKMNDADDWMITAMLGVSFRFGQKFKKCCEKKAEPVVVPEPIPVVEPEPEPVPEPVVEKKPEPKVVTVKEQLHEEIFYVICKSDPEVGKRQMQKVADFMKRNPNAKVAVVGYADKGTGNPTLNIGYSKKRAENCKAELVETYGCDGSRISVDYKGDTVQPFDENDKNRCVIIDGDGSHEETKYE